VLGALGQYDRANYQVSPNAYTLPKLLSQRDYESAIFGKFHIVLQQNNSFEFVVVSALGEDHDSVFGADEGTCYSADR
jgi:arylsulfatase A-like enzyme